ncbi:MAG: N-acetylmuramoyl-L-alanine amidase family protein [Eubacteriales bacterium]|nr:N-acetylmuramoyl-L-alanine amidase family protein [Eubacteriales bacterium]
MRRNLRLMFLFVLVILMVSQTAYGTKSDITQKDIDDGISFCKEYPVFLQVDGAAVETDVPPVIIKERTLIPARAVFESMGATVNWDEDARIVEITMGTSNVLLTIDSSTAFVNGASVTMEVPAMIIDGRTLIPVRFVAESLSCGVDWDDLSRTVILTSPIIKELINIRSIEIRDSSDSYRVVIESDGVIEGYKPFAYDSPERFGIDIKSAVLEIEEEEMDADSEIMKAVRFSQFDTEIVRVVVDLKEKVAGKVSYSSDKKSIYVDFDKGQEEAYEDLGDTTADGLDVVDWRATGRLVVIDPGHGGKDTGSQAIRDGVEILNEKDINLDIALRLDRMLKAAGVNTYMLREADTSITLYDRPAMANAANGDLYIAVHNNSSPVNPNARGVEVYYNAKANECDYEIYSKRLAEAVYAEFRKAIDIPGRGAKSEPAYAVLNKTCMPAIIIEGAFLSNTEDLKLMMTDEFRENYALATARAIVQILNESVKEE